MPLFLVQTELMYFMGLVQHGGGSEPRHIKLAFAIDLERSNHTLIIATTCETKG